MAAASGNPAERIDSEVRLYSYYRDAELRGSNLLYRLLRILPDGESRFRAIDREVWAEMDEIERGRSPA